MTPGELRALTADLDAPTFDVPAGTGNVRPAPGARRPRAARARAAGLAIAHTAARWAVPVALLVAWQWAASTGHLNARVLPAPSAVVTALIDLARSGELWTHFLASLQRAGVGVLIGGTLGFLLGILTGASRAAHLLLDSTFQMLRTIPNLALIPLVIVWFGIGETGKVFLIALATYFPVYLNTVHGVHGIDGRLKEMARVYGLSPAETFRRVTLPGALPGVLVGVRYALGISWLALVVSESFGASRGIGFLAMDAREFFRTDVIVLAIVIYALIGKAADGLVRVLEQRLLPWRGRA
ncbi:ABC transporter permease subunit [Deinococcus maricopensis]|uniref:ABC-type transporter, integral membrane subunit n=1 Tax=Deinococcus maricopensis (strain DSM 21211 / LMG 22137 / NRRL B-23946 / LB-34) TaxID=709986 RepID=E8U422_DEIML|nr:ABC transporter permease subunit [Deinococcus maricopensis]ADV65859.1 ABC-type transporter, integral membrane subunit [Deinococcus maricopensis DSM 21211]